MGEENQNSTNQSGFVQSEIIQTQVIQSDFIQPDEISNFANWSHQKGEIRMFTLSEDKIDSLLSSSNSLNANFFSLVVGVVAGIIVALYSGGIQEDMKPFFKLALLFGGILMLFFGIGIKLKKNFKKED